MRVFKKTMVGFTTIKEGTAQQQSLAKDQVAADEVKASNPSSSNSNDSTECYRKNNQSLDKKLNRQQSGCTNNNDDIDEEAISEIAAILRSMGDLMEMTMILNRNLYFDKNSSRFLGGNLPQ